ncbi:MAG: hypothetical protein ABI130_14890, partial [Leifsonia sp.]
MPTRANAIHRSFPNPTVFLRVLGERMRVPGTRSGGRPVVADNRNSIRSAEGPDARKGERQMAVVTMRQLLDSGVHFGHQTRRWNPKM